MVREKPEGKPEYRIITYGHVVLESTSLRAVICGRLKKTTIQSQRDVAKLVASTPTKKRSFYVINS
jgi:hypothetical protein